MIPFREIVAIQSLSIKMFEYEDDDQRRAAAACERSIWKRLAKITPDLNEQTKIYDAITAHNFDSDRTFKPICDHLRSLGYEIVLGSLKEVEE